MKLQSVSPGLLCGSEAVWQGRSLQPARRKFLLCICSATENTSCSAWNLRNVACALVPAFNLYMREKPPTGAMEVSHKTCLHLMYIIIDFLSFKKKQKNSNSFQFRPLQNTKCKTAEWTAKSKNELPHPLWCHKRQWYLSLVSDSTANQLLASGLCDLILSLQWLWLQSSPLLPWQMEPCCVGGLWVTRCGECMFERGRRPQSLARTRRGQSLRYGSKQDSLALKCNGYRVVQNSHACQCLAESARTTLGDHRKWEPEPEDEAEGSQVLCN